jgi:GNAT superfamily N-acetyltransferase
MKIRKATEADVPAIVAMLADDAIGATREEPGDRDVYADSFAAIDADPNQLLVVGVVDDQVMATLQLTFIPGLSRRGTWRAQIEGVRVSSAQRGGGYGTELIQWAVAEAKNRGCALVQLTSDARRAEAQHFYEQHGFIASHVGFKLAI